MFAHQVIGVLILVTLCGSVRHYEYSDVGLNIIELATKYGYSIESHEVQTEDGYILTLHRIPHGVNGTTVNNIPILLMHGLLSSAADWVNMGPQTALAYLLADEGYDVWLGNQRGNTWSRKHINIDPDTEAEKFFDFSFHEIGYYDLPAKIDYILKTTGKEKLFYVGHSQGTTAFFVMASERPEYNDKIQLMSALAPVAYIGNMPNPLLQLVVENLDILNQIIEHLDLHEILPHFDFITDMGISLCGNGSQYQDVCVLFINIICGFDWEVDPNFFPVITSNAPAGASIKQIHHYFQEVQSGNFCQYDYGTAENLNKYGTEQPPLYDTTKITAPVILHYTGNDWLAAVEDVERLGEEISNLVDAKKVPFEQFNHLDFLWARHVVEYLYNDVVAEIKSMS